MHKLSLTYQGRLFDFTYYSTTLNEENLYFVITQDPVAKSLLIEDHFFIRLPLYAGGMYWLNGIKGTPEETAFKEQIANAILQERTIPERSTAQD